MSDMRNEFREDLDLDPNGLDVECLRMADIFIKWADRYADAREEMDRAKFDLEVTEARLDSEIRREPTEHGIEKVTEGGIKAAIIRHPDRKKAMDYYLSAKKDSDFLGKGVTALEVKKRMIESLVTLHGQRYFAGPSVPRDLPESWTRFRDRIVDKQVAKTRKRRKKQ